MHGWVSMMFFSWSIPHLRTNPAHFALLCYANQDHIYRQMQVPNNFEMYLFEEVIVDMASNWISFEIEVDVHVFAKATRIVISVRLRITERFKDSVGLQQNVLYSD